MGRSRHRNRNKSKQGFSRPAFRPFTNMVSRSVGARGRGKRQYLNELSTIMVFGAAVTVSVIGLGLFGWFGAFIGFIVGGGMMSRFVVKERFHR